MIGISILIKKIPDLVDSAGRPLSIYFKILFKVEIRAPLFPIRHPSDHLSFTCFHFFIYRLIIVFSWVGHPFFFFTLGDLSHLQPLGLRGRGFTLEASSWNYSPRKTPPSPYLSIVCVSGNEEGHAWNLTYLSKCLFSLIFFFLLSIHKTFFAYSSFKCIFTILLCFLTKESYFSISSKGESAFLIDTKYKNVKNRFIALF